jgi:hypothetical protein
MTLYRAALSQSRQRDPFDCSENRVLLPADCQARSSVLPAFVCLLFAKFEIQCFIRRLSSPPLVKMLFLFVTTTWGSPPVCLDARYPVLHFPPR